MRSSIDFWDLTNRLPPKDNDEGEAKALEWSEAVAELQVNNISITDIRKMTKFQFFMALRAISNKRKDAYKRAGWTFEEKEKPEPLTAQDLLGWGWRERMKKAQEDAQQDK